MLAPAMSTLPVPSRSASWAPMFSLLMASGVFLLGLGTGWAGVGTPTLLSTTTSSQIRARGAEMPAIVPLPGWPRSRKALPAARDEPHADARQRRLATTGIPSAIPERAAQREADQLMATMRRLWLQNPLAVAVIVPSAENDNRKCPPCVGDS